MCQRQRPCPCCLLCLQWCTSAKCTGGSCIASAAIAWSSPAAGVSNTGARAAARLLCAAAPVWMEGAAQPAAWRGEFVDVMLAGIAPAAAVALRAASRAVRQAVDSRLRVLAIRVRPGGAVAATLRSLLARLPNLVDVCITLEGDSPLTDDVDNALRGLRRRVLRPPTAASGGLLTSDSRSARAPSASASACNPSLEEQSTYARSIPLACAA